MRKRSQRLWMIGAAGTLVAAALALGATALQDTVAYFYTPTQLIEKNGGRPGEAARIGGFVETGSVSTAENSEILFSITDCQNTTPVIFDGITPDLFAEGQGVVAEGAFDGEGRLVAKRVLARHDENYSPREVTDAMGDQECYASEGYGEMGEAS